MSMDDGRSLSLFQRLVVKATGPELPAVAWAFAYFFCLLSSYYVLRPVRDEMGIISGVENLQWLFTATFVAMLGAVPLFGAAAKRFHRHTLVPVVYLFFVANLLVFFALLRGGFDSAYVARAFFVWLSVFNLFVVSVFWSFMTDLFSSAQARRLFGFIAAGGSAGAVVGPAITAALAVPLGPANLLLVSAALLLAALFCVSQLLRWSRRQEPQHADSEQGQYADQPLGGGILNGIRLVARSRYLLGICLYIWLYTSLSTFLYFEQAHIIRASFEDSAVRTTAFAYIDLAVNVLTIAAQIFVTARLVIRFGLPVTLAVIPALLATGFAALAAAPVLLVLLGVQILRRAGNYAIAKPAREILFTVVTREEKYKAKNFIDTVVYRGGDALSGWLFAGLTSVGWGLGAIALLGIPLAAIWLLNGLWLGRQQETTQVRPAAGDANQ
jgi:AAA family ATP:ADP antiporter